MKKLFIFLVLGVLLFFAGQIHAEQTINTGNAVSGSTLTTCANLTGTVCTSNLVLEKITPTPVPGGDGTVINTSGSGGGGSSASSCGDAKPNPVTNVQAVAGPGTNEVTLSWLPPTGTPYSSFLVAYSDSPTDQKWGNPDIGNTTRFTVSSLGSGTYYFWVAAINGCMPGDLTGPVTTQTGAVFAALAQGVTEISPTPTPEREVKGTEQVISALCTTCIWWPFLLLEALALLGYWFVTAKKKTITNLWIVLVSIPILTYILFLLFNGSCAKSVFDINAASIFCKYFYLLDALIFIIYLIIKSKWIQRKLGRHV